MDYEKLLKNVWGIVGGMMVDTSTAVSSILADKNYRLLIPTIASAGLDMLYAVSCVGVGSALQIINDPIPVYSKKIKTNTETNNVPTTLESILMN